MSALGHPGTAAGPLTFTPPARRRIYLMRHGDVTYFDDSGKPVDADTVPLNALGREQASAAGRAFAAENIRFDRVIVSGLPRTRETAERVLAETGQRIDIETWTCWQEIRAGSLADVPPAELAQAFLSAFDGLVPEETRFMNGESVRELLDRVVPPLAELRADPSWDTVLLVLHGGVNRAILSHAMHPHGRLFLGQLAQTPACINALDVGDKPQDWVVRLMNFAPPQPLHRDNRLTVMEKIFASFLRTRRRD
ncbi:fructose-2,6-bisphosphatase [Pandoraea pnomenusa]|jgi:probable phosphoglycerate mutase|uniref:Bifunctional RNase H/acid phosphatase n=1 Tax=Pandoraea pnomenusa TaxID=93220 RepID=A0A378YXJ4_9BURK|nr:fructose-2,6-bisphosphatase [Pandoraea pnomenusa]AHN74229.2 fructose-2,6-bisphosphatase [Pandoraea pnomenusa]AIU29194.2 fructose-2,6-bisphosphatase [Pandoraea pnomenusa]QDH59321.1 histidine phosphatase family protein [Pandoraea pnomenusa]SUA81814.1 bifunctional RNase H/acid phosphatase [Pandoraea pnomenusa]